MSTFVDTIVACYETKWNTIFILPVSTICSVRDTKRLPLTAAGTHSKDQSSVQ